MATRDERKKKQRLEKMTTRDAQIKNTFEKGKYYNPALSHYASEVGEKRIFCDRCNRSNLLDCIGYENSDLCMTCVNELTEKFSESVKGQELLKSQELEYKCAKTLTTKSEYTDEIPIVQPQIPMRRIQDTSIKYTVTAMKQDMYTRHMIYKFKQLFKFKKP